MPRDRYDDDEDDEDDDRPPRRRSRRDDNDDEDEDDRPRRRSRRDDDDNDDDRPRRRSSRFADSGPTTPALNVCGLLALIGGIPSIIINFFACCGGWIPGIIGGVASLALGIVGLVLAKKSEGKMGSGLAVAGTILGGVATVFSLLWLAFFAVLFAARPAFPTNFGVGTNSVPTRPVKVAVTAADLARAYDNEEKADDDYDGEQLEVTGTVSGTRRDPDGGTMIILAGKPGRAIACEFDPDQDTAVARVKVGDRVTVRGECEGIVNDGEVSLGGCRLISGGGLKPPDPGTGKLTPATLTQAFENDPVKAKEKYLDQKVEISGTLDRIDRSNPRSPQAIFDTPNGQLACVLNANEGAKLATANKGDTVMLRGTCTYVGFGPVKLINCMVLK